LLPVCARPAPAVHVVGYRWPPCVSLHNGRAWHGVLGSQRPPACARFAPPPPHTAQRGTSPRLGAPCVRAPCARCTCGGLSRALMRQPAQWQGLAWRGWLAAALRVCPLRVRPPPLCPAWDLAAPRRSLCARALRPLYMWWAIGGPHASARTMAEAGVACLARSQAHSCTRWARCCSWWAVLLAAWVDQKNTFFFNAAVSPLPLPPSLPVPPLPLPPSLPVPPLPLPPSLPVPPLPLPPLSFAPASS
jgi:hypothetical protein